MTLGEWPTRAGATTHVAQLIRAVVWTRVELELRAAPL
jgi:hypothetical protein